MLRCTVPSILLRRYLARDRGRNCLRCHKMCPASQPCGIMRVRGRQRRLSPGYPRHGLCAAHPLERCQEAGVSCFNRHSLLEEGRGIRGWGYSPSRQRENVTQHRERAFYSGADEPPGCLSLIQGAPINEDCQIALWGMSPGVETMKSLNSIPAWPLDKLRKT